MKKKNLKSLALNKKSISNLGEELSGGKASGVNCVTQVGSCQTTSCVCTDRYPCKPSYGQPCGSDQLTCA